MKTYFLSALPCALTVDGVYFGKTDTFGRCADLSAKDEVFIEFHPENALPVGFFFTEKILLEPPARCEVYLMKDSIALYVKDFSPADFTLRPILQRTWEDTQLTVFQQGDRQVCIERQKEMFVQALPLSFLPVRAEQIGDFYLLVADDSFCLLDGCAKTVLFEKCERVDAEEEKLRARLPLGGGKMAKCEWSLEGGVCRRTQFTLLAENDSPTLLAYAFFESLLIGADCTPFLCDQLKKDVEKLRAFLGEFLSVLPREEDACCGLVYQKAERLFEVREFRVTLVEGKITDVQEE